MPRASPSASRPSWRSGREGRRLLGHRRDAPDDGARGHPRRRGCGARGMRRRRGLRRAPDVGPHRRRGDRAGGRGRHGRARRPRDRDRRCCARTSGIFRSAFRCATAAVLPGVQGDPRRPGGAPRRDLPAPNRQHRDRRRGQALALRARGLLRGGRRLLPRRRGPRDDRGPGARAGRPAPERRARGRAHIRRRRLAGRRALRARDRRAHDRRRHRGAFGGGARGRGALADAARAARSAWSSRGCSGSGRRHDSAARRAPVPDAEPRLRAQLRARAGAARQQRRARPCCSRSARTRATPPASA